jgi:tartrate-resistant acid phosphatase type 5
MFGVRSRRSPPFASLALLAAALCGVPAPRVGAQTVLVAQGSVWKFLDDGSDQGAAWHDPGYDDGGWASGPAQLGYGDGDEATLVRCTAAPTCAGTETNKFITTYFRHSFDVADPTALGPLDLALLRDDGAVVYLNGVEIFRSNMPCGAILSSTVASVAIGGADESAIFHKTVRASGLVAGTNVLAVEIHQAGPTSSDISFDLSLTAGSTAPPTPFPTPQQGVTRFAVIGDYGFAGQPESDVADLVESWAPEFVVTLGDNNYDSGSAATIDANIGQYYQGFIRPYAGCYGSGSPDVNRFFPSLGNHDWVTAGAVPYLDYFELPGNERYYELDRGPVGLFAVDSDPNEPDGITSGSTQAQWLMTALAGSAASWKLVYFHHPPYSSGLHGDTPELQWPFLAWGATAVLTGHDHTYERLEKDGFPYIVNGLGGRSIYAFPTVSPYSVVRYNADYGAMLVEARPEWLRLQFYNRTGQLIDTYERPAPSSTVTPSATATVTGSPPSTSSPTPTTTPSTTPTGASSPTATNGATLASATPSPIPSRSASLTPSATSSPSATPTATPPAPRLPADLGLPGALALLLVAAVLKSRRRV